MLGQNEANKLNKISEGFKYVRSGKNVGSERSKESG